MLTNGQLVEVWQLGFSSFAVATSRAPAPTASAPLAMRSCGPHFERSGGGSSNTSKTTAGILGWPAGTWLVGIAGAVLVGIGLYQGYRGLTHDFLKDSKTERMSPGVRTWVKWIGTFGHLARMVVFGLIGVFLIKAAVDYSPNKAVGLDGALAKLEHLSYGPYLLGIVAAGLIAFGVYSLSDARYRQI